MGVCASCYVNMSNLVLILLFVLRCNSTIIQTNGSALHFHRGIIDCPDGDSCSIYCNTGKPDGGICEGAMINCPTDAQCDLFCGTNSFACRGATINCPITADCNVYCSGTGQNTCNGIKPSWSPNGQNRLSCEGAGRHLCSYIQDFPVPPSDEAMVLNCDADSKCRSSNIICPSNANCTINCVADYACADSVIIWSTNGINTLDCDATKTNSCLNINSPPTQNPTTQPSETSEAPTAATINPTADPSEAPSNEPTKETRIPSRAPTIITSITTSNVQRTQFTILITINSCTEQEDAATNCNITKHAINEILVAYLDPEVKIMSVIMVRNSVDVIISIPVSAYDITLDKDLLRDEIETALEEKYEDVEVNVSIEENVDEEEDSKEADVISYWMAHQDLRLVLMGVLIGVICFACLCVCFLCCVWFKKRKASKTEMMMKHATETGQQTTNADIQTNQIDSRRIVVTTTELAATVGAMRKVKNEKRDYDDGCKDTEEEKEEESHESLYDEGIRDTTGGDTAGGNV